MKILCTLVLFIVLTGCESNYVQDKETLEVEPIAEKLTVPPEYAARAIENTGGMDSWGKVVSLHLDCIVTCYTQDEGYYLTEQRYDIYPWSNTIVVSGKDSQDDYIWRLSNNKFDVVKDSGKNNNPMNQIDTGCFTKALLNLVTAPVRFLDKTVVYTRGTSAINIQRRWCYPISANGDVNDISASNDNMILYQNRDSFLVDMVLVPCQKDGSSVLICGYDYEVIKDGDVSIPGRIDLYQTDENGMSERRLLKIDIVSTLQK